MPADTSSRESVLDTARRLDDERPSLPAEHWLTLAAGLLILRKGGGGFLGRTAGLAAGVMLVARALSGRDGLLAKLEAATAPSVEPATGAEGTKVKGRRTASVDGHVVASTAEPASVPSDGGAAPAWTDDSGKEGRDAAANLKRERDPLTP